jgi:hypothetical protein
MHIKKKLLTTAVGATLTLGLAAPAQASHMMLFPYVVKDSNRTTVVTVMGEGQPVNAGAQLHLQYWTKSTTDANTAACQPNSSSMTFTDNDIASWDTAALLGAGPLFGDTTNAAPLGTSISYAGPRHGYLIVNSVTSDAELLVAGYWMEVDIANGGAHGDIALRGTQADDYSFVTSFNSLYPGLGLQSGRPVTFWPSSVASTVFTVTPLGTAMLTNDNNQVVMQVLNNGTFFGFNGVQGAYDRNENGVDGTVPQTVRCVGRLTAAQLMPGVVANAAWAATGGWGWLTNLGNGNTAYNDACTSNSLDCPAVVYQVDTSNAAGAGKFMSNATRIQSIDF